MQGRTEAMSSEFFRENKSGSGGRHPGGPINRPCRGSKKGRSVKNKKEEE